MRILSLLSFAVMFLLLGWLMIFNAYPPDVEISPLFFLLLPLWMFISMGSKLWMLRKNKGNLSLGIAASLLFVMLLGLQVLHKHPMRPTTDSVQLILTAVFYFGWGFVDFIGTFTELWPRIQDFGSTVGSKDEFHF